MQAKKFYNTYYSKKTVINNKTFEEFLYNFLKRYEVSRYDWISNFINKLNLSDKNILDLGCWEWKFFEYLNDWNNLYGIDIAGVRLEKNKNRFHLLEWDLEEKLPWKDDFFDIITSMSVMEHVFSIEHHLREVHRLLKKWGYFILEVPNVAFLPNRIRLLLWNTPITWDWTEAWDDNHLHYFTKNKLKNYLKKYWFDVLKITWSWVFAKMRNRRPSLLCGDLIYICRK
jgi:SAM-dependent methyltransferase